MRKNQTAVSLYANSASQITHGVETLLNSTSDWQTIREYICNRLPKEQLTEIQQKKLDRYTYMYNQTMTGKYSKAEIISQVITMLGVDQRQAYEDYNSMQELFGTYIHINKLFEIKMQIEGAKRLQRKAEEAMDFKGAAAIQKNLIALYSMIPDEEQNMAELFKGHSIEAVYDPRLLGAPDVNMGELLKAINSKRKVKINVDSFEQIGIEKE